MKKKIIGILICTLFIGTYVLPCVSENIKINTNESNKNTTIYFGFILDQNQTNTGNSAYYINKNSFAAQSFTPSMTPLVKVDLFIGKDYENNPIYLEPLTLHIREELNGNDLTSSIFSDISEYGYSEKWRTFDIPDVEVVPFEKYYIVLTTTTNSNQGSYLWGKSPSDKDYYIEGNIWRSLDTGITWQPFNGDFCFKTYSYGANEPPFSPLITGSSRFIPHKIYEYKFVSTDPDGDDIYYYVKYWDSFGPTNTGWKGPYKSGEPLTLNCSFGFARNYNISAKARDVPNEVESDWATLTVTLPKNKAINLTLFLQRMFQRFLFFENY